MMLIPLLALEIDKTTAIVIIAVVFLIVAAIVGFRARNLRVKIGGPGVSGELNSEGAPDRAPGSMKLKDIKGGRDVKARSGTGGGVSAEKIRAGQDVDISSNNPGDAPKDAGPKR
jgi:hypothetical protein